MMINKYVADLVSRSPLLYDAATPNSIICVGALGVVCAVMTRGRARLMDAGRFIKPPHFLPDPEARRVEECSPSQALWDPVACHELEPPRPASPPRSTQLTSQGRGQIALLSEIHHNSGPDCTSLLMVLKQEAAPW